LGSRSPATNAAATPRTPAAATADDASPDSGDDKSPLVEGQLIAARYRLEKRLGTGAMGEVWRARHEDLRVDVAIKFALNADCERLLERFRFEAQVAAQLGKVTDHIVAVHDTGSFRRIPFLVMEFVAGSTLDQRIDAAGRLSPDRVADLLDQLAEALDAAHAHDIWHRDIKGANVMVSERDDGGWHVKLADFGVAKSLAQRLDADVPKQTMHGMLVGTPSYMSPEQICGAPPSAASDLWSLAVVAYEALTGVGPFGGNTLGDLMSNISTKPFVMPSKHGKLPVGLDAFFARALSKRPSARFTSAGELALEFRRALAVKPAHWRWIAIAAAVMTAGTVAVLTVAPRVRPQAAEAQEAPTVEAAPPITAEPPVVSAQPAPQNPDAHRPPRATATTPAPRASAQASAQPSVQPPAPPPLPPPAQPSAAPPPAPSYDPSNTQ
jgi:hypothetical protein